MNLQKLRDIQLLTKMGLHSSGSPLADYCVINECFYTSINGFNGYWITSDGRVWSDYSKKWLVPAPNSKGYLRVCLYRDGKKFNKAIHRLVAEAFVPNDDPEHKTTADHIDGDKTNNCADNLQWLSNADNVRKSNCKPVMLFDTLSGDVEQFNSQTEAAAFLGCSTQYMSRMTQKPQLEYMGWCVLAVSESGDWHYNTDRLSLASMLGLMAMDEEEQNDD